MHSKIILSVFVLGTHVQIPMPTAAPCMAARLCAHAPPPPHGAQLNTTCSPSDLHALSSINMCMVHTSSLTVSAVQGHHQLAVAAAAVKRAYRSGACQCGTAVKPPCTPSETHGTRSAALYTPLTAPSMLRITLVTGLHCLPAAASRVCGCGAHQRCAAVQPW